MQLRHVLSHLFVFVEITIPQRIAKLQGAAGFCDRSGRALQLFVQPIELVYKVEALNVLHSIARRQKPSQDRT